MNTPYKVFKIVIIRMFNAIKEDTNKLLNEFKQNINQQLDKIRNLVQDVNSKSNKEKNWKTMNENFEMKTLVRLLQQ